MGLVLVAQSGFLHGRSRKSHGFCFCCTSFEAIRKRCSRVPWQRLLRRLPVQASTAQLGLAGGGVFFLPQACFTCFLCVRFGKLCRKP